MIKVDLQGNLLKRTAALESGRAMIDFSNVTKPYIDTASGAASGGYIELSNGIKICWGVATPVTGLKTINFPVVYTSAPVVSFSRVSNSGVGVTDARYWCNIIASISAAAFSIYGDLAYQGAYLWVAIGV